MKKIICLLLVISMMLSCIIAVSAAEKVEIRFYVGDSTLTINGNEITVEKPYVVGAGVTLVPIRVITEAFGAKVEWIAETKTVKLEYADTNIVIQIDNPIAKVNGKEETLLAAPELTENGYTMIPLRFIAEKFGATVSYDENSERITVVLDNTQKIGEYVKEKYIGDSFYGWSMKTPSEMIISERDFSGSLTEFSEGDNNISVVVYPNDEFLVLGEELDLDELYVMLKLSFSESVDTLLESEKDSSNPDCQKIHLAGKDKTGYGDFWFYITPKYIYIVMGLFNTGDSEAKDKYIDILSSFECRFNSADTYDLSESVDGYIKYKSEPLKLSLDIPLSITPTVNETENTIKVMSAFDQSAQIGIGLYSKGENDSAKTFAESNYNLSKKYLNEELAQYSEAVTEKKYDNFSAFEYSCTVKQDTELYIRDVYFELGDYLYNFSISLPSDEKDRDKIIDKIINTITAEELDSNIVGIFEKEIPDKVELIEHEFQDIKFKISNLFTENNQLANSVYYSCDRNGVNVTISSNDVKADSESVFGLDYYSKDFEFMEKMGLSFEYVEDVHEKTINGKQFIGYVIKRDGLLGNILYEFKYSFIHNSKIYSITIICPELGYSENTLAEIEEMLNSITFK